MQLTFLGTGTSSGVPMVGCSCDVCTSTDPRDHRLRSSALVRTHGLTLLIDAGPDARQQLLRAGVTALDAVLLTHAHMDHISGIDDLRAFNFFQKKPMDLYGDRTTLDAVRRVFAYAFGDGKYPGTPQLDLHEIGPGPFEIRGVTITPVEVEHYLMPVLGFRIGNFSYVTDAKSIAPAELEKLLGSDVLVLNALRHKEHISHFTLGQAIAVAREIGPRRVYFTHISHQLGRQAVVSTELPAGMHLAYDGLVVDLLDP